MAVTWPRNTNTSELQANTEDKDDRSEGQRVTDSKSWNSSIFSLLQSVKMTESDPFWPHY